ncbi:uncharacterized protein LOC111689544 isoform X1 [Lucilia cuprina]|uniref:uncharacterized protein LOC111689544 isoform X1 n=1 Tax=Lucilia cuprina TaxID=7375 RepID=UPI001F05D9FF|nr:uncharacterized protein LOC111689544 isoform X1 [Lucilia cuprina]
MFKLLIYLNLIIILFAQYEGRTFKKGRLNDNSLNEDETPWQNLWFPHPPNYQNNDVKTETVNVAAGAIRDATTAVSNEEFALEKNPSKDWLWFPHPPGYQNKEKVKEHVEKPIENVQQKHECDNGKFGLSVDYDPLDKRHSYNYLCLDQRSKYTPNLNTTAILKDYTIPAAYEPSVKCLNETIEYSESIPTFGAYRPLAPKYGSYSYLPPQRWLHSLADGAIVLLYHPCAFAGQIDQLQNTLKGCLYRHIITPSQQLTPQRPLALLAWGKSLQMSVVDDAIAVKFIKDNAKLGFRQKQQKLKLSSKMYDAGLLTEAHLVTDEQDEEICGYKEMR